MTVGTDMLAYGVPVFKSAYYAKDFGELFNEWSRIEIDIFVELCDSRMFYPLFVFLFDNVY